MPHTKVLIDILAEIQNRAIRKGYDDLSYRSAQIYLRDLSGLSIRMELPGNGKKLNQILSEIEAQAVEDGYDDLQYISAKIYLIDSNGLHIKILLPKRFFSTENTPPPPETEAEEDGYYNKSAINLLLLNKVNKVNTSNRLYGTTSAGEQSSFPYSEAPSPLSIGMRTATGTLQASAAVLDDDLVNQGQLKVIINNISSDFRTNNDLTSN